MVEEEVQGGKGSENEGAERGWKGGKCGLVCKTYKNETFLSDFLRFLLVPFSSMCSIPTVLISINEYTLRTCRMQVTDFTLKKRIIFSKEILLTLSKHENNIPWRVTHSDTEPNLSFSQLEAWVAKSNCSLIHLLPKFVTFILSIMQQAPGIHY